MQADTQTLLRLVDGELTARNAKRMEAHRSNCPDCTRESARLEAEKAWFAANDPVSLMAPPPLAVGLARVHAAFRAEPAVRSNMRPRRNPPFCGMHRTGATAPAEAAAIETFLGLRAAQIVPGAKESATGRLRTLAAYIPDFVFTATLLMISFAVVALCAWQATGNSEWIRLYYNYPASGALIALYALEVSLGIVALRQFSRGEPLRRAWVFIVVAAGCHFVGSVFRHLLGTNATFNPLSMMGLDSGSHVFSSIGSWLSGPAHMGLLATGILIVLHAANRHGFLARLTSLDMWTMGAICVLAGWHLINRVVAGGSAGLAFALECIQVVLVLVLLAEAILLRRAVLNMRWGIAARCWGAFSAAIYLTCIANVTLSGADASRVPWPLAGAVWCLWLVAAGAYALAPAYQIHASALAGRAERLSLRTPTSRALAEGLNPGC